jgi:hypothetical protein
MVTPRSVRDEIANILDFLVSAEIAVYANTVSMLDGRVSFHQHNREAAFLLDHGDPTLHQYLAWVEAGAYSAVLYDGSLLQMTYTVKDGRIVGHRLAYVPCPYDVDLDLIRGGEPIADVVRLYSDQSQILRSPIRFDFDPDSAKLGHPSAHFTINNINCRIACIAPMHSLRFVDFIFRNFYRELWMLHFTFFVDAPSRHLEHGILNPEELMSPHIMWNQG